MWTGISNLQQMICILKAVNGHLLLNIRRRQFYEITENAASNRTHTFLMSSRFVISGDSPPCTHRNCWFISAASGRQSKASIHASYTLSEYLILPVMGGNRAGKGENAKSNNTALIHWAGALVWDGKVYQGAKKLPIHILKTAQFSQHFCVFFIFLFTPSPTVIVLTCVNIKKVNNMTESCRSPEGTFK